MFNQFMCAQADQIRAASHAVLPRLSPKPQVQSTVDEAIGGEHASPRVTDQSEATTSRNSNISRISESRNSHVSRMSEAQKSLASITSLMSSDLRRIRGRHRTRRQSQAKPSPYLQ